MGRNRDVARLSGLESPMFCPVLGELDEARLADRGEACPTFGRRGDPAGEQFRAAADAEGRVDVPDRTRAAERGATKNRCPPDVRQAQTAH